MGTSLTETNGLCKDFLTSRPGLGVWRNDDSFTVTYQWTEGPVRVADVVLSMRILESATMADKQAILEYSEMKPGSSQKGLEMIAIARFDGEGKLTLSFKNQERSEEIMSKIGEVVELVRQGYGCLVDFGKLDDNGRQELLEELNDPTRVMIDNRVSSNLKPPPYVQEPRSYPYLNRETMFTDVLEAMMAAETVVVE